MKYVIKKLFFLSLVLLSLQIVFADETRKVLNRQGKQYANHGTFLQLKGPFRSRNDIMSACVKCHNRTKDHIEDVLHWVWHCNDNNVRVQGGGVDVPGRQCQSADDMEGNCLDCHNNFRNFSNTHSGIKDESPKVDCLICHDTSNLYKEFVSQNQSGKPIFSQELMKKVSSNIDYPVRENCGNCHFSDKHKVYNDLDSSLVNPSFDQDVHMDKDGLNFRCRTCHTSFKHTLSKNCEKTALAQKHDYKVIGKEISHERIDLSSCESCHSSRPHKNSEKLNDHTDVIACQTCHIQQNLGSHKIEYHWHSGVIRPSQLIDGEDGKKILLRNIPIKHRTKKARLFPFRVTEELGGQKTSDGNEIGKIITYWPYNHKIAPSHKAMKCDQCHRDNPVISNNINHLYIPGNYKSFFGGIFDILAWIVVAGILAVVSLHGSGRFLSAIYRKMKG